jgi:hypothetical protein
MHPDTGFDNDSLSANPILVNLFSHLNSTACQNICFFGTQIDT